MTGDLISISSRACFPEAEATTGVRTGRTRRLLQFALCKSADLPTVTLQIDIMLYKLSLVLVVWFLEIGRRLFWVERLFLGP